MSGFSLDPLVGPKAPPPVVAGVSGDDNLEPKQKQMIRKLVNGAKDEGRPYLEAERRVFTGEVNGKYHMNICLSLHTFGLLLKC